MQFPFTTRDDKGKFIKWEGKDLEMECNGRRRRTSHSMLLIGNGITRHLLHRRRRRERTRPCSELNLDQFCFLAITNSSPLDHFPEPENCLKCQGWFSVNNNKHLNWSSIINYPDGARSNGSNPIFL